MSDHTAAGLIFFSSQFYWNGGLASVLGRISLYPLRVFPIARDVQSTCAVMQISCYSKESVGKRGNQSQMSTLGSFLKKSSSISVMGYNSVHGIKIKGCFIWFMRCIFSTPSWWWLDRSSGLNYGSCWQTVIVMVRDTFFFLRVTELLFLWTEPSPAAVAPAVQLVWMESGACCFHVSTKCTCGQRSFSRELCLLAKTPK